MANDAHFHLLELTGRYLRRVGRLQYRLQKFTVGFSDLQQVQLITLYVASV